MRGGDSRLLLGLKHNVCSDIKNVHNYKGNLVGGARDGPKANVKVVSFGNSDVEESIIYTNSSSSSPFL